MSEKKVETYTGFSGADFVLIFDGKVYGEFVSCRSNSIDKIIELDVSLFNTMLDLDTVLFKVKDGELTKVFVNEYGVKIYKTYSGLEYKGQKENHSIDDIAITNTYIFDYKMESFYFKLETTVAELIEEKRKKQGA